MEIVSEQQSQTKSKSNYIELVTVVFKTNNLKNKILSHSK